MVNANKHILAVGSIAIDTIETEYNKKTNILGGSAAYFAVSAATISSEKVVGVVGNDYPDEGWNLFKHNNINTENIQVHNGNTFRWGGKYNKDFSSRETLYTELGVFETFSPKINREDCNASYVFLGNIQPQLQLDILKQIKSPKLIVIDTMNLWIDLYPETLHEVLQLSDVLLINDEEACQLSGFNNPPKAAVALHKHGPKVVVIKQGSKGAFLSTQKNTFSVPVYPLDMVVDPTGAGDTFAGGFIGHLASVSENDFLGATITGAAFASFSVEDFSPNTLHSRIKSDFQYRQSYISKKVIT